MLATHAVLKPHDARVAEAAGGYAVRPRAKHPRGGTLGNDICRSSPREPKLHKPACAKTQGNLAAHGSRLELQRQETCAPPRSVAPQPRSQLGPTRAISAFLQLRGTHLPVIPTGNLSRISTAHEMGQSLIVQA